MAETTNIKKGTTTLSNICKGNNLITRVYKGTTVIWEKSSELWTTPTIELTDSVVSTMSIVGVTKYKIYSNGTYIGYIDSDNVWHGEVSE